MGVSDEDMQRCRSGMAMVEMAFVLPVLLLLVFAIAEMGLMFQRWLTLSNAVREGARHAIVYQPPGSCTAADIQAVKDRVVSYANAGGVPIASGDVTVSNVCGASNTQVSVSASYPYPFQVLPGLSTIAPTIVLQYAAQMRNE